MSKFYSSGGSFLRIANVSGFYGDRFTAMAELLASEEEIHFITGDYLAELTMYVLGKQMRRDPSKGYALTFLRQLVGSIDQIAQRGIKVVVNAGGLNPARLALEVDSLVRSHSLGLTVGYLDGDDVVDQLLNTAANGIPIINLDTGAEVDISKNTTLSANAYLGAFEVAKALELGADIVVCPRITDASLVVGPAIYYYGWSRKDYDKLAGAVVAGHILECGTQCTGGNYSMNPYSLSTSALPGYPVATVFEDGSCEVTKVSGSGGLVSIGTVTEQLLYEIGSPKYINPDVVAHFDTLSLTQVGKDRVRVEGAKGSPGPSTYKVAVNLFGGYRNQVLFALTGLDVVKKAELVETHMIESFKDNKPKEVVFQLVGDLNSTSINQDRSTCLLRVAAKDPEKATVGREFSNAAVEIALASYAGLYLVNPPQDASEYAVFVPTSIHKSEVSLTVHILNGANTFAVTEDNHLLETLGDPLDRSVEQEDSVYVDFAFMQGGPRCCDLRDDGYEDLPIGSICGSRSGDKGGNANLGVWTWDDHLYRFLLGNLTVANLRELLPELNEYELIRYELKNLYALNFVVVGFLGEGVSSTLKFDAQAKALGEFFRARRTLIPDHIVRLADGVWRN